MNWAFRLDQRITRCWTSEYLVSLLPYTIFSLFHALTFTHTTLMPQFLPQGPPATPNGLPTPHPLAKGEMYVHHDVMPLWYSTDTFQPTMTPPWGSWLTRKLSSCFASSWEQYCCRTHCWCPSFTSISFVYNTTSQCSQRQGWVGISSKKTVYSENSSTVHNVLLFVWVGGWTGLNTHIGHKHTRFSLSLSHMHCRAICLTFQYPTSHEGTRLRHTISIDLL